MSYTSLEHCLLDLEKNGHLVRINEEVDPHLEMAAIHLRVFASKGPAILFERVKGSRFRAASNIFGSLERSQFMFRNSMKAIESLINIKQDPTALLQKPLQALSIIPHAIHALPLKNPWRKPVLFEEIQIADLPLIKHWPMDGGAFVTLPQVYTEDPEKPGVQHSNLGMYRIQLDGNEYTKNKEIGLHYQLHRGIGVHQTKANQLGKPLRVSIFVGGPPAHTLAAVMPLPEGMSELNFAGVLGSRRFRYDYRDGFMISTDADFVITGEVYPGENKPEGPFGDHLGYYSLQHPFPVMRVHKVYARKQAIWPFTVVGRPPQEDTSFGALIHAMTGHAVQHEIPGLKSLHAVDAAGVHPLLLAIGSERYTPFLSNTHQAPAELLTISNRILGTGQLSLAKYLFITDDPDNQLDIHDIPAFFNHVLSRIDLKRDMHFHTQTSIDTLDYSGETLNRGSKVVFAASGKPIRTLSNHLPDFYQQLRLPKQIKLILPGIVAVEYKPYTTAAMAAEEIRALLDEIPPAAAVNQPVIWVLCDDAAFVAATVNNFLWVTFTRSNPSHDIYGKNESHEHKHWACDAPLLIDARMKPHHAPAVLMSEEVLEKTERIFQKGGSLYGI
ncbi:MAG: UbiD family decarboxylase [Ferruginibacter sp.]